MWIVPIEVGGITPTSVTTAVMLFGGVRSYNGFKISRLAEFSVASDSRGIEIGNVENIPFNGPKRVANKLLEFCRIVGVPSSFFVKLSSCTVSEILYVSQQTTTGTECCFAIIETRAVPARECTAPFEWREWAPMKTIETSAITEPMAGRRRYVQGIPADDSAVRSFLPKEIQLFNFDRKCQNGPSSIGLESTT